MNTLIVGSIAFDAIETPFTKTDKIIGGAGTYVCFSASYFTKTQAIAVVGYDFPEAYIQKLHDRGVDTEGVQISKEEKTFFWSGRYFDNMNQRETLVTELNVMEHFTPIVPDSYKNTEYVMLGNLSPVIQRQVLEQMNHKPKFVALDTMNFWMDTMLVSYGLLIYLSYMKLVMLQYNMTQRPLFFLGIVCLILGVQLFLSGFLAEMISRTSSARNEYLCDEYLK